MKTKYIAFLSYSRFDDTNSSNQISILRLALSMEVQLKTTKVFTIFQDTKDIGLGENWRESIKKSLENTLFFIPIITPHFFKSKNCKDELKMFIEREKRLSRNDLILPLIYINCKELEKKGSKTNPLVKAILDHHYIDCQELRSCPPSTSDFNKKISLIAEQIKNAMERIPQKLINQNIRLTETSSSSSIIISETKKNILKNDGPKMKIHIKKSGPTPLQKQKPNMPNEYIVDAFRGEFRTIREAINAAQSGDRIIIKEGRYQEGIVMNKNLEIIGEGDCRNIIISSKNENAVLFNTNMGRIANLQIQQKSGGNFYAVDIQQGRLIIENCEITSESLACIAIHGNAYPKIYRCKVHDSSSAGICFYDQSEGELEESDIYHNAHSGIEVSGNSNPKIRRNGIRDGKAGGIYFHNHARGLVEENDIYSNHLSGIAIEEQSDPIIRRNKIHHHQPHCDVYIYNDGIGTLESNEIYGSMYAGILVESKGNPMIYRNSIHDGLSGGIYVAHKARCQIEQNNIL